MKVARQDLQYYTDYKKRSLVSKVLKSKGYKFTLDSSGWPVIQESAFIKHFETMARRRMRNRKPTKLYRCFDDEGNLLYIGISITIMQRLSSHSSWSEWFDKTVNISIETLPDRPSALKAEKKAIKTENPIYNRQHNQ